MFLSRNSRRAHIHCWIISEHTTHKRLFYATLHLRNDTMHASQIFVLIESLKNYVSDFFTFCNFKLECLDTVTCRLMPQKSFWYLLIYQQTDLMKILKEQVRFIFCILPDNPSMQMYSPYIILQFCI